MFEDADDLRRKADEYMNKYVSEDCQKTLPRSGADMPSEEDARFMAVHHHWSTVYKQAVDHVKIPPTRVGLPAIMSIFEGDYMRNDVYCPLRDRVMPLEAGRDYMAVFRASLSFLDHDAMVRSLIMYEAQCDARNMEYGCRYKKDCVLGILDILIRYRRTPKRSLSTASCKILSLFVKNSPYNDYVYLGITALEAYAIFRDMIGPAGPMHGKCSFFTNFTFYT